MPRVFISYARESDEHDSNVLALAQRLRSDGVDCRIDAFINGHPPEGWLMWMEREIAHADYILIACSEVYLKRFKGEEEPGKGLGVTWESQLTRSLLYGAQGTHLKVVPVCFSESDRHFIPEIIRFHTTSYVMTAQYEKLLRYLTGQPAVVPESLSAVRSLPVEEPMFEAWSESADVGPLPPQAQSPLAVVNARSRAHARSAPASVCIEAGHYAGASKCCFTPDGSRLLTFGLDESIRMWDVDSGCLVHAIQMDRVADRLIALNDNRTALMRSTDLNLHLIDLQSGAVVNSLPGLKSAEVLYLAALENGMTFVSVSHSEIRLWSLPEGKVERSIPCEWITAASASAASLIAVTLISNTPLEAEDVCVWDLTTGAVIHKWNVSANLPRFAESVALSGDGNRICTGNIHGDVDIWTPEGTLVSSCRLGSSVCGMVWAGNDRIALTTRYESLLWDISKKERLMSIALRPNDPPERSGAGSCPTLIECSPASERFATVLREHVLIWDASGMTKKVQLTSRRNVTTFWVAPDGRSLPLISGADWRVFSLVDSSVTPMHPIAESTQRFWMSPDRTQAAVRSSPDELIIRSYRDTYRLDATRVVYVAFSHDNRFVAVANTRVVRVFEISEHLKCVGVYEMYVDGLMFSPCDASSPW